MSGHSKWSTIKHKKAATDAKRGKIFTKLAKEITVAAREGGGNMDMNARLRTAVQTARDNNMPGDNIDRAIKKGTGELPGLTYVECVYEGYGPGGVAIFAEIMTDNKNRTAAELRKVFSKRGASIGESGCVAWMFTRKGFLSIPKENADEETLMDLVLEAGAEDIQDDGDFWEVYTSVEDFENVKNAIKEKDIKWEVCDVNMIPNNTIKITDEPVARQILLLMEELEDHDDVQKVSSNFDIDDELISM